MNSTGSVVVLVLACSFSGDFGVKPAEISIGPAPATGFVEAVGVAVTVGAECDEVVLFICATGMFRDDMMDGEGNV